MNIFVYSDESGVFDVRHNKYYVYGGLIFLNKESKEIYTRKYLHAERTIRESGGYDKSCELKACRIENKEKYKLMKSLNQCIKFGAIVMQNNVHKQIFEDKKSKQRFLDYVYKISLKRAFESLIKDGFIDKDDVKNIYAYADEHTTATDGRYELKEALEQEFKNGTFNYNFRSFYPPIFTNLESVQLKLCDSSSKPLIRAADIVANNIYYHAVNGIDPSIFQNIKISFFP